MRAPRWSEVREFVQFEKPSLNPRDRALNRAASLSDIRAAARRFTPKAVFDYTDGSAGEELALRRQREAFRSLEFHPTAFSDVSEVDPSTEFLGQRVSMPIGFGPTGFTRMMHHAGEKATASVAGSNGLVFVLSTLGTTSPEDLKAAVPHGNNWFQLYISKDRSITHDLIDRVEASGCDVIELTIDTPVGGIRRRDIRNGLTVPPKLTPGTALDMAIHPSWWWHKVTEDPLEFASLRDSGGTVSELLSRVFEPALTLEDIAWLRERWSGSLVVKGVQSVVAAQDLANLGVNAIVLSNHGGRQLDRAPVPLELLPDVVAEVAQDIEVYIDGGVTDGADALAAVALGARGVFVGRAHLYGLMAGGRAGVQKVVDLFREQLTTQMALLGVRDLSELTPEHVRFRPGTTQSR
jgi:L-lactate dehydrogenase (cytochrome)